MIVLDTNVVSEVMRSSVAVPVAAWMRAHPSETFFVTTLTEAEILYGIARLPGGRRRQELHRAATAVLSGLFAGRVLPFDSEAARAFAEIGARKARLGRRPDVADMVIAAIAASRRADLLATRNIRDFEGCGVALVNPWEA